MIYSTLLDFKNA